MISTSFLLAGDIISNVNVDNNYHQNERNVAINSGQPAPETYRQGFE